MILFILFQLSFEFSDGSKNAKLRVAPKKESPKPERLFLNENFFDVLKNYQTEAQLVDESKFPWIARVVHSVHYYGPHLCTASCIEPSVFITAARCLFGIKIRYTTLIYQEYRLKVKAFVLSSKPTRQMYDDIGFIVTQPTKEVKQWEKVKLFKKVNRTDEQFYWFDALEPASYKVLGFAIPKGLTRIISADHMFNLTQLDITVGTDLCSTIFTFEKRLRGYSVPCYHSCTLDEYREHTNSVLKINSKSKIIKKCLGYHGVEGGAVIDTKSGELFGVATWGGYSVMMIELPVGFSVPNSKNFFEDWRCAKKIAADATTKPNLGHYQKLCDEKK